jgi:polyisoprenyl-teichoic acid--peptidoglycan teichoic acid transferase
LSDNDADKRPPDDGEQAPELPPPVTWAGRKSSPEAAAPSDEPGDDELEEELDDDELSEEELAEQLGANGKPEAAPSDETVEADTLALADREAAHEAALAGLRARTAEHTAKQGAGATAVGAAAATVEPEAPAEAEPEPQADEAPPSEPTPPPEEPKPEEGPAGRGLWARFVAGSLLIIVSMATATAVSVLVYLTDIARGLGGLPSVQSELAAPDAGKPQTILILGSDKRPKGQGIGARSDTTLMMRVAPDQITMMSIPRDLKVNIPGHGIDKFNAAYSYGGPKLTLKVVKQLTGLDNINHVINVDFNGFADAVDAVDCVYVDVDHHYFHSNVGLAPIDQYAEIDIPAGYQRMCGYKALQYVRYRHDDNDLVRAARQQEFLRQARQELPATKLISNRNTLIGILKKYVTSDIEDPTTLVSLGKLFLAARHAPVVQIHFPANLGGPTASYVTASATAIKQAVARFEGTTPTPTPSTSSSGNGGNQKKGSKKKPNSAPPVPVIDATAQGQQYAAKLAGEKTKGGKPMLDFPIYFPTKLANDSSLTDDSDAFLIDGPGSDAYRGYKFVAELPTDGYTAYYGVSGTSWTDPPILANLETRTINGHDYLESWSGGALRLIGWKTDNGSYWVDNTLLNVLTPGQMAAIAESMHKYTG